MNYDSPYLAHFGTPGQKWGQRRYQNPDGTLTPEGRAHYGIGERRPGQPMSIKEYRVRKAGLEARKKKNESRAFKAGLATAGIGAAGLGIIKLVHHTKLKDMEYRKPAEIGFVVASLLAGSALGYYSKRNNDEKKKNASRIRKLNQEFNRSRA